MLYKKVIAYADFLDYRQQLDPYLQELAGLTFIHSNMANFLIRLSRVAELQGIHLQTLIDDEGHGFAHGVNTLKYALEIYDKDPTLQSDPRINKESLCIAALLHDINGLKISLPNGTFLRDNHSETGSTLAEKLLNDILTPQEREIIDIEMVRYAISQHDKDCTAFVEESSRNRFAAAIRDADTIDEGMNIPRIVKITESYANEHEKIAFKASISIWERIAILMTEEPAIRDAAENDLLMFLLRNVTKSIDPDHFVTAGAKQMMQQDMLQVNRKRILEGMRGYKYPGDYDPHDEERINAVIDEVVRVYNILKVLSLIDEAKGIVQRYSGSGRQFFDVPANKSRMLGELSSLIED